MSFYVITTCYQKDITPNSFFFLYKIEEIELL